MEPRIQYRSAGEIVASAGPLFLRIMSGVETTDESVDRLVAGLDRMLERWSTVGVLVLVEHGTPSPTPEIRRRVDEELRRYGQRIVIGYAFLGLGFWISDAREFAAERAAVARTTVLAATELPELATKVAFELIGVTPELIVRSFEWLRERLREQPPTPLPAELSQPTRR